MGELTRYDIDADGEAIFVEPDSDGEWVCYDDAQAAITQRDERIAELTELLAGFNLTPEEEAVYQKATK